MTSKIDVIVSLVPGGQGATRVLGMINRVTHATQILGKAMHQVGRAISFYVTFRIFSAIYRAVDQLTNAIPDLIHRGEEWAATLLRIQETTGMAAEQTGKLAGVARLVGVDTQHLGRDLAYLGRNVIENEEAFAKFGVRVRDADGALKSSYDIFQDVRRAISSYGRSFLSTAAAQRIFSEGGRDLLRLLQLTDPQWQRLARQARQAGLVMSEAGLAAARAWERTRFHIDSVITGLGSQILGGVAPALSALVNGIANAIQKNMDSIVDFVSRIVVTLAGFVSGLFGIEIRWKAINSAIIDATRSMSAGRGANVDYGKSADRAAKSNDRQRNSIERQVDAIDRQIAKLDRVEDRRRARREYAELQRDISDARKDLSALRNEHLFFTGMSLVEGELARQAHAADIIEGEKRLNDAKKALREFERDQELADERNRLERLRDNLQERLADLAEGATRAVDTITRGFQKFPQAIRSLRGPILEMGEGLKEAFGEGEQHGRNLVRILQSVQQVLQGLVDIIVSIGKAIGVIPKNPEELANERHRGELGARRGAELDRWRPWTPEGSQLSDKSGTTWWTDRTGKRHRSPRPLGVTPNVLGMPVSEVPPERLRAMRVPRDLSPEGIARSRGLQNERYQGELAARRGAELVRWGGGGSASGSAGGGTGWQARPDPMQHEKALRKFFGRSSEFHKGQREQNAELGSLVGNTDPLTSGELGTKTKKWEAGTLGVENPRIGQVDRWSVGPIGVDSPKYQDIGNVKGWFVAPIGVQHGKFAEIGDVNRWGAGTIGVQHGRFDRIGRVDSWEAGTLGTNVQNRVGAAIEQWGVGRDIGTAIGDWQVPGRLPTRTDIEASSVNNLPTRVVGWATRAEANVDVASMSTDAARTMAGQFSAIFGPLRHAMGGPAVARHPIIVGEEGPEIFTPHASGTIYSNPETRRFLGGNGTSGGTSVGAPMSVTIQLDPVATRSLLEGRAVNTSTRAGRGV
jgi:hypothetical protein